MGQFYISSKCTHLDLLDSEETDGSESSEEKRPVSARLVVKDKPGALYHFLHDLGVN